MSTLDRREFLKKTLGPLSVTGLGLIGRTGTSRTVTKYATDRIALGPEGMEVSRLAIGTGTSGVGGHSNQTRQLGVTGLADLLRFGYDHGVTFWDSADQYGSHTHLKTALETLPRENIQILTKTHARTARQMEQDLSRFRKELGTDYIDILLLHMMLEKKWPQQYRGAMDVISRAKEEGVVRTHGVSCHTLAALNTAAEYSWVDVDLVRINPQGVRMDADPGTVSSVLKRMKQNGKGVIGMKILGDGRLAHEIDDCLRYALSHDSVDCFTIGTESRQELRDLIQRIPKITGRG